MTNKYEELSIERKESIVNGCNPSWLTTPAYQMLKGSYLTEEDNDLKKTFKRISKLAAERTYDKAKYEPIFYELMWSGSLALSTPVLANMGTNKAMVVSCTGNVCPDEVRGFYDTTGESAVLSQEGFGTSSYLGGIRPRGSLISRGGKASGVLPVIKQFVQMARDINQGCYDEDTKVLTDSGWKLFKEVIADKSIKVAQVHNSGATDFVTPSSYIQYRTTVPLVSFNSQDMSISVTPDHRMVFKQGVGQSGAIRYDNDFSSKLAEHIELNKRKKLVCSGYATGDTTELTPNEKFKIAYQADGKTRESIGSKVRFNFKKVRKIEALIAILENMDVSYSLVKHTDGVTSITTDAFRGEPLEKNLNWVLPLDNKSSEWCSSFIDEVMNWDGWSRSETCKSYYTVDATCALVVSSVASLANLKVREVLKVQEGDRLDLYVVTVNADNEFTGGGVVKSSKQYEGEVYCVTVPTGNILVQSKGLSLVCGNCRRGAWAGYLEITHGDFWEVINYLQHNPQDLNIGWIIPDSFIEDLKNNDEEALKRYKKALYVKLLTGKGYFAFIDRANRNAPQAMVDQGLTIKASQLCCEVFLFSDEEHSYGCLLSSMNAAIRDYWPKDAIFNSMIFLDAVCSYFLEQAKGVPGVEKVLKYMEKSRSVGLGVLGYHTALQQKGFPFDSIDAVYFNGDLFKELDEESLRASKYLAGKLGEPEWCKGYGIRFLNRMAVAPNTSSAIIAGSVSPGIEPMYANAFVQPVSGGEVNRVNPVLIPFMENRGVYSDETILDILANDGSVQHVTWLSDEEKEIFLTAFEINQMAIVLRASQRQKRLDQGQSLNLFFHAGVSEEYISKVHQAVFLDKEIIGLYYIRSNNSNKASSGEVACASCAS